MKIRNHDIASEVQDYPSMYRYLILKTLIPVLGDSKVPSCAKNTLECLCRVFAHQPAHRTLVPANFIQMPRSSASLTHDMFINPQQSPSHIHSPTSPLPFEVTTTPHNRNARIHDPLSDTQVLVHPVFDFRRRRKGVSFETGAVSRHGVLGFIACSICRLSATGSRLCMD